MNFITNFRIFLSGISKASEIAGSTSADPATYINDFNDYLLSFLGYAGCVIIVIGIVHFVLSVQQQDASQKVKSGMEIALGVVFVGSDAIIKAIGVTENRNNPWATVQNVCEVFASALKIVGFLLVAIGLFQFILALMHEDPGQKVESSKLIGTGSVLWCIHVLIPSIITAAQNRATAYLTSTVISLIVSVSTFIGAVMAMVSLINLVIALKEHDASVSRHITVLACSIILICMGPILTAVGIYTPNVSPYTGNPVVSNTGITTPSPNKPFVPIYYTPD